MRGNPGFRTENWRAGALLRLFYNHHHYHHLAAPSMTSSYTIPSKYFGSQSDSDPTPLKMRRTNPAGKENRTLL
ncbi:hypothetical protein NMY22_g4909 [Coprinellus aureogranulatus]|nr:hypothetical protein NMY22_g4909 [Coprinellus aureogranulatus]